MVGAKQRKRENGERDYGQRSERRPEKRVNERRGRWPDGGEIRERAR
jgi:hypothetical protein